MTAPVAPSTLNLLGTPQYDPSKPATDASGNPMTVTNGNASTPFDPFQQFQGAGGSYLDAAGHPVEGAAAPTGIPYYASSQLVQNADGSTASATGTAANPFAGFQNEFGGGFGADPSTAEPNRGLLMDAVSEDPTRVLGALNSSDPEAQKRALERLTAPAATAGNRLGMLSGGRNLTPEQFQSLNPTAQKALTDALAANPGDPQAKEQQLAQMGISKTLTSVGNGTYLSNRDATDPNNVANQTNAQRLATDAALSMPDPVTPDATPPQSDPFGRFDSPTAASHVITPAYEAQLAAQSGTLTAPPPNPALPPPTAVPSPTASPPMPTAAAAAPSPSIANQIQAGGGTYIDPGLPGLQASVDPVAGFGTTPTSGDPFTGFSPISSTPTTIPANPPTIPPQFTGPSGLKPNDAGPGGRTTPGVQIEAPTTMSSGWSQPSSFGQIAPTAPADGPGQLAPRLRPIQGYARPATGAYGNQAAAGATNGLINGMRPIRPAGGGMQQNTVPTGGASGGAAY